MYVVDFVCSFDMTYYPFDVQDCTAEIEVAKEGRIVSLVKNSLKYIGPSDVMKYMILETKDYNENGKLIFKFSFGRRLMSVFLTTMLPTTIVVLVALSKNYYAEQHFKTVIPVNLTCLLLMVNLFVGLSSNLPETSKLKMIDVWLVVSFTVPFTIVILHGYLDHLRKKLKKMKGIKYSYINTYINRVVTYIIIFPRINWK